MRTHHSEDGRQITRKLKIDKFSSFEPQRERRKLLFLIQSLVFLIELFSKYLRITRSIKL